MDYVQKGNRNLLSKKRWGVLASRKENQNITQRVIQFISRINQLEHVLMSGWHSPTEKQVHNFLINEGIPHIHLEAKGLPYAECKLGGKDLLFISTCADTVKRITRARALRRNEMLCELSDQLLIPQINPGGKTHALVEQYCTKKDVFLFDAGGNPGLLEKGAKPIREHGSK